MLLHLDVIREVIAHLQSDSQFRTLLALGLTCQMIRSYALDAIWFRMTSLIPLLRSFPGDVWQQVEPTRWVSS